MNSTPPPTPEPSDPSTTPDKAPRRPRGKIARLLPPLRLRINQMLDEGVEYSSIIEQLATEAPGLGLMDISRWYGTGHQAWLRNQLWLEETRTRLDFATEVIIENEGSSVHQANLHIAATQLIHNLINSGEAVLKDHPEEYVALVNAITRLSREALNFQKYREACVNARSELAKLKDPARKLSEAETLAIVDRVDEILGFK